MKLLSICLFLVFLIFQVSLGLNVRPLGELVGSHGFANPGGPGGPPAGPGGPGGPGGQGGPRPPPTNATSTS